MSLSVYDPEQGCNVLNPEKFAPPVINAFHPDYVKTFMPEFLSVFRVQSTQQANGVINGGKSKAKRESVHGNNVNSISVFPKTKRVSTEPKQLLIFSRAGTANVTPKGKKK